MTIIFSLPTWAIIGMFVVGLVFLVFSPPRSVPAPAR
jgi:hypothetical protein